ncbi:MAG: VWA domain-containing protein [Acidobacteriota bacterium]|nr:VWA domain-containing protein [Acidobacteriota bacterium]
MKRIPLTLRRAGTFALVLLVMAGSGPAGAQAEQTADSLFFDTVDVNVINIEVVVQDRDGNPVTGLTRDDFLIYEDGVPVEISNFFEVIGRKTVAAGDMGDTGETTAADDSWLPTPATKRLNLVILIDNLNMGPQNRNLIFKQLRRNLEDYVDSRDRVMLVSMDGTVKVEQPFTNSLPDLMATLDHLEKQVGAQVRLNMDHSRLLRAIHVAKLPPDPGLSDDLAVMTEYDRAVAQAEGLSRDVIQLGGLRHRKVQTTVRALRHFTDSLAGMPGRKAVLYLSDGLPVRPADSLTQAWMNKFEFWVMSEADRVRDELTDMTILAGSSEFDSNAAFDDLTRYAAANQVAFYPLSNGARSLGTSLSAEFGGASTVSGAGPMSANVVSLENINREAPLIKMAGATGGLAFTRTSNIGGLLERMVKDFNTFYSLGYVKAELDNEFHDIKVKLVNPGLEVRHLGSYRKKDPMGNLEDLTLSALHYDLEDNPLGARLDLGEQVATEKNSYQVPVMLKIPFQSLLLIPRGDVHEGKLSVLVIARDDKGGVSKMQRLDVPIQVPNEQMLEAMGGVAAYPLQLELNRGRKHISVGVRDEIGRVDSTLSLRVAVGNVGNADSAGFDLSRGNEGGNGGG